MANELIREAARGEEPAERRIDGAAVGQVVNNVDVTGQGRVQLRFSWLPDMEPWARVCTPAAGSKQGFYWLPQIGDEVLVMFHQGDVTEPFVVGSLWNGQDPPPRSLPTSPLLERVLKTPLGHEIAFDDQPLAPSVKIRHLAGPEIRLEKDGATLEVGSAKIELSVKGEIRIRAAESIRLEAPRISLEGANVELRGSSSLKALGGADCEIRASVVRIN